MHNINRTPEYREVYVTHLSYKVESRCIPITKDTPTHEGHAIIGFSRKPSSRKAGVHYFFREKQEPFTKYIELEDGRFAALKNQGIYVPHNIRHKSPLKHSSGRPLDDEKTHRITRARWKSCKGEINEKLRHVGSDKRHEIVSAMRKKHKRS